MRKITLGTGGFTAEIWTLGASVNDVRMPDRYGTSGSVVLGHEDEKGKRADTAYLGAIVGPVANRIGAGGYTIDNVVYTPELNESEATLHGGPQGFHIHDWDVEEETADSVALALEWEDPAGGFPGPISARVEWSVEGMELTHRVRAWAQVPTNLNIVAHPYFNLSGTLSPVTDHEIQIAAGSYLPIDRALIPLPEAPKTVSGSALDLRAPHLLGEVISATDEQIVSERGLDHAFVLDGEGMRRAATLRHPASGRTLEIVTDYPALQVYSGQGLGSVGVSHPVGEERPYCGVALETEDFPDAPRRADFPSILIRPGQEYIRTTTWKFSVESQG